MADWKRWFESLESFEGSVGAFSADGGEEAEASVLIVKKTAWALKAKASGQKVWNFP